MKATGTTRISNIAIRSGAPRKFGRVSARKVVLAGATALALTAAVAAGAWQLGGTGGEASPAVSGAAPAYRMAEPDFHYYIVGSNAQAQEILADAPWLAGDGRTSNISHQVLVLGGDGLDEEDFKAGLTEVNISRRDQGLSPVQVFDLR